MRKMTVELRDKTYKGAGRFSEEFRLNTLFCEFAYNANEGESAADFAKRVISRERDPGGRVSERLNAKGVEVAEFRVENMNSANGKHRHGELIDFGIY